MPPALGRSAPRNDDRLDHLVLGKIGQIRSDHKIGGCNRSLVSRPGDDKPGFQCNERRQPIRCGIGERDSASDRAAVADSAVGNLPAHE